MIRGSDISKFWEVLDDNTVLHSFLDGCSGVSEDSLNRLARILSCCLFLLLIPMCISTFLRPRKGRDIHTRAALRALLTIVAPTCSLWPNRYIKLASINHSHVDIPIEMIIEDTSNGVIEFRNAINDLADLIGSGTTVNGYGICTSVAWKSWINCFRWWMFAKPKSGHGGQRLDSNTLVANPSPQSLSLSPFTLTLSTSYPPLCLDYLPYGTSPSLNAGCKATLEFTAFSPSLRALSYTQVISAIPFITSERSPRRPRSLVSVLKQLQSATYGPNLVVESVSNISTEYEHSLCHVYETFSGEQKIREMWVQSQGIKGWRRDMFLVALEAALLRRGWIERWAIQVTAK